jgi:hypothetical protein
VTSCSPRADSRRSSQGCFSMTMATALSLFAADG